MNAAMKGMTPDQLKRAIAYLRTNQTRICDQLPSMRKPGATLEPRTMRRWIAGEWQVPPMYAQLIRGLVDAARQKRKAAKGRLVRS